MAEPTFYQLMTSIVDKKIKPTDEQIDTMSSFVTVQYLSNDPMGCIVGNTMNIYSKVPMVAQYRFFRYAMPKNVKYIQFLKKPIASDSENLLNVCRFYDVNETMGKEYLEILKESDLAEIKDYYAHGRVC